MKSEERISSLLVMHEDGTLDPQSARELEELLGQDETAGQALVEHYLLTAEMEDFLGHAENRKTNLSAIPLRTPVRPARRMSWGLVVPVAFAASLVVVVGAQKIFGPQPDETLPEPTMVAGFATVREQRGPVEIVTARGRRSVSTGASLKVGESIEVGGGAVAALETDDGTRIDLGAGSRFTAYAEQTQPGDEFSTRVLRLDRGSLRASVARQIPGHFLAFVSPHARATVLGTELSIAVEETLTRVSVDHGKVLVEGLDDGTKIALGAGQSTTAHRRPVGGHDVRALSVPGTFQVPQLPVTASWDFEDGILPSSFMQGQISAAPTGRKGNRFAIVGTVRLNEKLFLVGIESRTTLVRHSDKATVAFDYWLPANESKVVVQIRNLDQRQNYKLVINAPAAEIWTHAEILLSDFQPNVDQTRQMEPGDVVDQLYFVGGRIGGGPFFVDNIRIFGDAL